MSKKVGASVESRLCRLSVPVPESGCWLWLGATTPRGYGKMTITDGGVGRSEYVHRAAWRNWRGDIPHGLYVCHKCDTPSCVNPEHLFLGTAAENVADMFAKARNVTPQSRLTHDEALEILASKESCNAMGAKFGVSGSTVHLIRRGRRSRFSSNKEMQA